MEARLRDEQAARGLETRPQCEKAEAERRELQEKAAAEKRKRDEEWERARAEGRIVRFTS